jgi:hypothetical protein
MLGDLRRLLRYRASVRGRTLTKAEIDDLIWKSLETDEPDELFEHVSTH